MTTAVNSTCSCAGYKQQRTHIAVATSSYQSWFSSILLQPGEHERFGEKVKGKVVGLLKRVK